jgi:transposase
MVNVDRDTPMLLPPDLRDWVPEDDLVHFVIGVIEEMSLPMLHINRRGSGSPQYPPKMMLALLVYCYANGIFSSRRIEHATYRDVAVRFLAAGTHPDHDTICAFRQKNTEAIRQAFLEVLLLAKKLRILRVGTISIDGTHIRASASKNKNVRYDRALELEKRLKADIAELMKKAEEADNSDSDDGQRLPEKIGRRQELLKKIQAARESLESDARERAERKQVEYEKKLKARSERAGHKGAVPKPPDPTPRAEKQKNLTDHDSRLMRKSRRDGFTQSYNAQAAVDARTMLIVGTYVTNAETDSNELVPAVASVDPSLGKIRCVLADSGYVNGDAFDRLESDKKRPFVALGRDYHTKREYDYRPTELTQQSTKTVKDPRLKKMAERLDTDVGRWLYRLRNRTVEPVFGIAKSVMGFRQFSVRGLDRVNGEWSLVALAYNVKRLANLKSAVT